MAQEMAVDFYYDDEDDGPGSDRLLSLAFMESRHTEKIQAPKVVTQTWRMKDRMKTVSVALVLCLNVGVDPPDVVKTSPCARLECWIDPVSMSPQKALEAIGNSLQKQYERWQPRARYKQSLDPTGEEVKKLCTTMRRNAKDERVLFHYNGHGVPKPTANGEIWVFNKNYTQYIPLSIYDLQSWMGSPSIYVYDCSNAGVIVESFKQFSVQREQEREAAAGVTSKEGGDRSAGPTPVSMNNCIQLAACSTDELLPMNPDLPADLFTACLTTPIKTALKWYVSQNAGKLISGATQELVDKIPGQLQDRRTMLGELNWIFTAITDTIAWNMLPRELFQKLFRQDLLVASLFRNFLLAERIMRSYNCTPASSPALPPTYQHRMWHAWDLALDMCLRQLPHVIDTDGSSFIHSSFFAEQLTAFQVWLGYGTDLRCPPEQLPIVLQVLLSQVHRLRALELLGRFLDLGPWAVSLALSVGIFPYVLKLLQSSARELRPLLVFIWSKILAVDSSCQTDLVKDNGHKYFLSVLSDPSMQSDHRTMAAFVLAMIVNNYPQGQKAAFQGNVIAICLEQLNDSNPRLRQWLALCLGKVWMNFDSARWCGVRDLAHEKLSKLLSDGVPEVRAAAVFALGTYISNSSDERSDHASNIDLGIGITLTHSVHDGCPLVRKELAVAFGGLVQQFETPFAAVAAQMLEEERLRERNTPVIAAVTPGGWNLVSSSSCTDGYLTLPLSGMRRNSSKSNLKNITGFGGLSSSSSISNLEGLTVPEGQGAGDRIRRTASSSSLTGMLVVNNVYVSVWRTLLMLAADSHEEVKSMAKTVINTMKLKATVIPSKKTDSSTCQSAPSSPPSRIQLSPTSRGHSDQSDLRSDGDTDEANIIEPSRMFKKSDRNSGRRSPATVELTGKQKARVQCEKGNMLLTKSSEGLAPESGKQLFGQQDRTEEGIQITASNHAHDLWKDRTGKSDNGQKSSKRTSRQKSMSPLKQIPHSAQYLPSRKIFEKGPTLVEEKAKEDIWVKEPLVVTEFFQWCSKYFAQPLMKKSEESDPESRVFLERDYRFQRNATVRIDAKEQQFRAGYDRLDDQIFLNRNSGNPTVLCFHPYEPHLGVADKDGVSIWDWENGMQLSYHHNNHSKLSRITSMDFINAHDQALLLCGSDEGSVRVWRNYSLEGRAELVTAFQAVTNMLPLHRGSGLITHWNQNSELLYATGDVRIIRTWDMKKELKIQDLYTGADSCVTSIDCDPLNISLLVAGCGDGTIRIFDRRMGVNECLVKTLREHSGWVVNVHYQMGISNKIVSASHNGDIRFWDLRHADSVRKVQTQQGLTAMDVHGYADVLACGSMNQSIVILNQAGEQRSVLKYHEGFMGQRIGPVKCLAFHPYKVKLAAGCTDALVSVYVMPQRRS